MIENKYYIDDDSTGEYCGYLSTVGYWITGGKLKDIVYPKHMTRNGPRCPKGMWGPHNSPEKPGKTVGTKDFYSALCAHGLVGMGYAGPFGSERERAYCSKGWGRSRRYYRDELWTVACNNSEKWVGEIKNDPVYGYVTRYRDVYYNYIAGRVSKA